MNTKWNKDPRSTTRWWSPLAAAVNAVLSLNRLGRGNAALFLLLSFGARGDLSFITHLVLGFNAALWYNGYNDLCDLEIDRAAYAGKGAHRKALLNGAMTARGLWAWLLILTAVSTVLLVVDVQAGPVSLALVAGSVLASIVYNRHSKYLKHPAAWKIVILDAVVGAPFYLFYASLAVSASHSGGFPVDLDVMVSSIGSLLGCGIYGNFIFAVKDLSTDAKSTRTLPMILGSRVGDEGKVKHSTASKTYIWTQCLLLVCLYCYTAAHAHSLLDPHLFGLAFAMCFVLATKRLTSGQVTERDHKTTFILLSNWQMVLLVLLHAARLTPQRLAVLVALAGAIVLLNVGYYHNASASRPIMLRFRKTRKARQGT